MHCDVLNFSPDHVIKNHTIARLVTISCFPQNLPPFGSLKNSLKIWEGEYYQNFVTKCDRSLLQNAPGVTKCGRGLYQSASGNTKCGRSLLQSVSRITKWIRCYKVWQTVIVMCSRFYKVRRSTISPICPCNCHTYKLNHSAFPCKAFFSDIW